MPEKRYFTLASLKGLLSGSKQFFRNAEVRSVNVPRYKSLSLKHVLTFALNVPKIAAYLPDQDSTLEPQVDREFVFTIFNTCDLDYFPSYLARNE